MTQYLYDGAISPDTANSIRSMMERFPYPLELREFPGKRMPKMPDHPIMREGCMGESYASTSAMWGLVHKDFSNQGAGCFLFLCSPEEKKMIEDSVPDLVVNSNPFKTVIA